MYDLSEAYRRLADALKQYTFDVEVSGSEDGFALDEMQRIPEEPRGFDQCLYDEITADEERERDDVAMLVRLSVLWLQKCRKANYLNSSLDGKGLKYWNRLCERSRERQNAAKIYSAAKKLEKWARAKTNSPNANNPKFIHATNHKKTDLRDLAVEVNRALADSKDRRSENVVAHDFFKATTPKQRQEAETKLQAIRIFEKRKRGEA